MRLVGWTGYLRWKRFGLISLAIRRAGKMPGVKSEGYGNSASCRDTLCHLGLLKEFGLKELFVRSLTDFISMQALYVVPPPRFQKEGVENSFTRRRRGTELASPTSAEKTDDIAVYEACSRYKTEEEMSKKEKEEKRKRKKKGHPSPSSRRPTTVH